MAQTHLQSILQAKIAEIEVCLEQYRAEVDEAQQKLVHLRAAAGIINERISSRGAKPSCMSVRNIFKRNEAYAICKQALAKAPTGLGTGELTDLCLRAKGLNTADKLIRRSMMQALAQLLRKHPDQIAVGDKRGKMCVWRLTSNKNPARALVLP